MPARPEIPPPGRRLSFAVWTRLVVSRLRDYIPDVKAAAKGRDVVVLRYGGQEVMIRDDGGTFRITRDPRWGLLQDAERYDSFTATNFAKTL
jgi:hypothetical protein